MSDVYALTLFSINHPKDLPDLEELPGVFYQRTLSDGTMVLQAVGNLSAVLHAVTTVDMRHVERRSLLTRLAISPDAFLVKPTTRKR